MTKVDVNPSFVDSLLDPLIGLADDDDAVEYYWDLNPNDETAVRSIIRETLRPEFERWDDKSRAKAKLALQYMLSFRREWCESIWNNGLIPFDAPDNPCLFFEWLWRELFGDEPYELNDKKAFNVVPDIHAPNLIVRHPHHEQHDPT